ncbi:hypothetical protein SSX86_024693 [Deinandra increscens subsp. villosa]|uniref:Retrotransposon gag domain-containing protein n=1 Tax=Deinandra increscens subsp. villosa TaxID=3103831 RepID=A0AAP0CI22_9ASTR
MTKQFELTTTLVHAINKLSESLESSTRHQVRFAAPTPPQTTATPPPATSNPPPPPTTTTTTTPPPPAHNSPKPPKITLPLFDGSNPLDWIFQAENYFTYYQIPVAQRLSLAVFYFTKDALSWYKHLAHNNLLGTWPDFKRALELRFGPSSYENHQSTLFKLRQTTTVTAYQTDFERLANRVIGLSPETLKNCFISGLKSDIQNELAILHPHTLHQTYGLARLIEDKLHAGILAPTVEPSTPAPPPSQPASLPLKRLTQAEMQAKKAAGICFHCDDKFQPGHPCKTPQFLLFEPPTEPPWLGVPSTVVGREDTTRFNGAGIDTNYPTHNP